METLELKTSELLAVRDELTQLLSGEKISFLAKFKISSLFKEIGTKLESYDTVRREVIEKYGVLDEKKENYTVPEEAQAEYQAEMKTLLESPIQFPYEPLDIALIGNIESSNVYFQIFRLFK